MDARKQKALKRISQCFLLFLVLRIVEELLVIPRFDTRGMIACVGGVVILLVYIRFINEPLETIGMIFSGHKVRKGIILAAILNIVPAAIVFTLEYFRISRTPVHTAITVFFKSEQYAYSSAGFPKFAMWLAIGILVDVIHAFFYETAFRGLLITLGSRSMRFWKINLIQSGLYTFWFLFPVLRVILYYSSAYSAKQTLTLFLVMLVYQMLISVKLGLLRAATGSVWACIFDHIAFGSILDMIHIQTTDAKMEVQLDGGYYARIIAYQAIALLMVCIYYIIKKKKIKSSSQHRNSSHAAMESKEAPETAYSARYS